ncbi:SGS-domain-containing protein [Paxillus ammoniavirescens]|nr:SGS-domain-containing protein [Paxillus ammoniavirescens]
MTALRHEFYETDERLTLSVFDRGANPTEVSVKFEPRKLTYQNGDKVLSLQPLKGQIDPNKSDYAVGQVKVEIRLAKMVQGRWGSLVGDTPDPLAIFPSTSSAPAPSAVPISHKKKNWEGITTEILVSEKEKSPEEDPNVGGDTTVNTFFQKIFADADDDTRRAMMKSFQESGGTTLSTNWEDVKTGKVEVKPPAGSEWKKWS